MVLKIGDEVTQICNLRRAIDELTQDGDQIALEGFSHLIPFAAGRELIRTRRSSLRIVRMTPDLVVDEMVGAGCVAELTFSWAGNPGLGSLPRFRDAVENEWPQRLVLDEHSHAGLAVRYAAGAAGLPFGTLLGFEGSDLAAHTDAMRSVVCPFTGRVVTAVEALRPDAAIIHAQQADRHGNVQLWGVLGVQKEAVLSAQKAIVTVEEFVPELLPVPGAVVIPAFAIDAVCLVPHGAAPSYVHGYSHKDVQAYRNWGELSRDRERFRTWLDDNIYGEVAQ